MKKIGEKLERVNGRAGAMECERKLEVKCLLEQKKEGRGYDQNKTSIKK